MRDGVSRSVPGRQQHTLQSSEDIPKYLLQMLGSITFLHYRHKFWIICTLNRNLTSSILQNTKENFLFHPVSFEDKNLQDMAITWPGDKGEIFTKSLPFLRELQAKQSH